MLKVFSRSFKTLIETGELATLLENKEPIYLLETALSAVPQDHFLARLPHARIYVVGDAVDSSKPLPFMLPLPNTFSDYMGKLGIVNDGR
jgi:3-mercaptopyruvate sulfurtransferase SseA